MFITVEGIDGSGKTTLARNAAALLARSGREVVWTREPGDWSEGGTLRGILLGGGLKNRLTEPLLFLADRCEHVSQTVLPALKRGAVVVCERYCDSTRAYQCWGRGVDRDRLETLIRWCAFPLPDLTLWLDLPVETALRRVAERGGRDRIESEMSAFHSRVARGYGELAREYPKRIVRLDAARPRDEIARELERLLLERGAL